MATNNSINSKGLPIPVAAGGTGVATLTANSLLVGEGTSNVVSLGAATNGQLPIGSTGADPVLATITAGTGISVTNGAGSITIAANSATVLETLTGNSGGARSPTAGNINIQTANSNATFVGSSSTLTVDFGATTNLALGNSIASLSGGANNVGLGLSALNALTSASRLTAIGVQALTAVTSGNDNTAVGYQAGNAITTGTLNTFFGNAAGNAYTLADSNNISIGWGAVGVSGTSNRLDIGTGTGTGNGNLNKAFISGIQTIGVTGTAVLVSTGNQLGVAVSSARFKQDVQAMADSSNPIYKLRPVTFTWDKSSAPGLSDAPDDRQFGLIAEEVAQTMPHLVNNDKDGNPFSVHYERLIPMLLNEIQRLEKRVTALEAKAT